MKKNCLLFDLDGTLTDPAQGICGCIRYALQRGGYKAEPLEAYHNWIGPPLMNSFREYLNVSEDEGNRLVELYRERFSTIGLFENVVYPGIPEMLRELREHGVKMAVATGKPTVYATQILEHFDLLQFFDYVSGISLTNAPLQKDGVIAIGMEKLGAASPEQCLMVGDRHHDVIAAQMNHVANVYVLYGYGSKAEAEACKSDHIVETVEELQAFLLKEVRI